VLGRTIKTEILNWDGTGPNGTAPNNTVYSATVNTYNARDQVIQAREYAGPEGSGTYQDTTMNYDGYGRLQLKHVPEQNAGTFTTWVYNTDDTVQSITDARGATTTFTYNNARHLPNVITHTLSGSSTITESFNYDAPRNRTSMTDGFGNVSYEYDQLSRLKSETRTLTGVTNPNSADGKFKLSYDYNLAGELKTITDPWNATINYGFDLIGRMSNVSGTNYSAGIINNIAYRAWGAPKQITYGNSRIASTTYNSRMQASHFEVPSVGALPSVMSIDYQYNADGRIEYSHNILDPRFDRSYEYDHATRITTALSGAEARGEPATTDRPYNETFDHDAFDHLTSRDTESWSKLRGFYSNDSYTNNRRNAWVYDAQGNLTNDLKRQYTYNAAAQETLISSSSSSLSQFFDGLGNRIKTIEFGIGTYYLWSTPLGQVVSELNSSGAKQRGYVYAGGKLIADGLIVHDEVSGTSVRKTDAQSGYTILFDELDPMGADAYTEDPYVANPNFGGRGEGGPVYPGYGNISMPSTGCTLDGVYIPCDMADRVLSQGAAMQCPNNDCSPRRVDIDIRDRFGGSQQRSGLVANPFFDINLVFFGGRAQAAYNAYIEAGSFQSGVYDGIKAGLEYTENQHANPQNTSPTPQVANSTGAQVDPCRSLMSNPEQWQSYVNDVVFNGVDNVAMNPPYKIDTGTQSSGDFLNSLKNAGWWWPSNRPNLNREHAGGTNLQREVEAGKWIHITVFPGQSEVTTRSLSGKSGTIKYGTKKVDDWNKLPRDIQLHCERGWLQPSSFKHLKDFLLN
jgi:YD repeat-containing protein